jgi:HEAT repeat protein
MRSAGLLAVPVALLASCGGSSAGGPQLPELPPLRLSPLLPVLKELAAKKPSGPDAAAQRELQELAEIALLLVEADARTLARAERSLVEHPLADFALAPVLADSKPEVRRRAAWLMGRTGRALLQFPLLLRQKDETDGETQMWIADALHRVGNDSELGRLAAGLDVASVQECAGRLAVALLREAGVELSEQPTWTELQQALVQRWRDWQQRGVGSRRDVVAADPAAVDAIVAAHLVATEGTLLRPVDEARFVLTHCGVLALPLLTRALQAEEAYLRTMALQVLSELGAAARSTGDAILPLLGDPLTASYAMRALGEIGHVAAAVHLRARLQLPDTELRSAAANALGLLRDEPSGPALAALLADASEAIDVRVQAAFARLRLGADAAAEAYLAERERKGDYHEPTLRRLRERLAAPR